MKDQLSLLTYRNRLLLLFGVVALCGGLVACSRMASKPEMPEPMVPVVVASQIEQSLSVMVRALSDPEILVAPQTDVLLGETDAEAPPMVGCPMESTGVGDATDSDGDNYPVEDTRTFDCEIFFFSGDRPSRAHGQGRHGPGQRGQGEGKLHIRLGPILKA